MLSERSPVILSAHAAGNRVPRGDRLVARGRAAGREVLRPASTNMVAEVWFIGSPHEYGRRRGRRRGDPRSAPSYLSRECLHPTALCAAFMPNIPAALRLPFWTRDIRWGSRGHTLHTAGDIFHCKAVGALVELSWKHAHGPGRAVLSASRVRDILRNLKYRAFSSRCPAVSARPVVARSSRACIIVYMLYFRIRRRLTSC